MAYRFNVICIVLAALGGASFGLQYHATTVPFMVEDVVFVAAGLFMFPWVSMVTPRWLWRREDEVLAPDLRKMSLNIFQPYRFLWFFGIVCAAFGATAIISEFGVNLSGRREMDFSFPGTFFTAGISLLAGILFWARHFADRIIWEAD